MRTLLLPVLAAAIIGATAVPTAHAHPGRLDASGCHRVTKTWTSKDGQRTYPAGSRHCHQVSDQVVFGQDEIRVMEDEGESKAAAERKAKHGPR